MISVRNLSLSYHGNKVLNNIGLELPSKGLIALLGPSGCGKTSLFNCLSGLINYEGEIIFDNVSLTNLSVKEMNDFRLRNIGFIFQDFKLFNLDTVEHNVSFPFEVMNGYTSVRNNTRISDLLLLVGLERKNRQIVKNLSGGEKQRVAIARALVNNPSLILADEPTGALDEENAKKIMELLRNISKDKLVIVVSHDAELIHQYADQIIHLEDGKIIRIETQNIEEEKRRVTLIHGEHRKKHPSIPLSFLFRHTTSSIKERKWRSILINLVTSLGLIGVGLATSLSSSISTNIKKACSSLMSENQIMFSSKEKNDVVTIKGKTYDELNGIKNQYQNYVEDIGAIYETDFNSLFIDQNEFYLIHGNNTHKLNNYSAKHINEFKWLDHEERAFIPYKPTSLANDEIVLNLSLGMVHDLCYELQIIRTVEELGNYINNNNLLISFNVKNNNWQYEDQHLFKIKAFTLDYELGFYHYNHLFNEEVFEQEMRLPSSLNLSLQDVVPWTIKKLYYLELKNDIDKDIFLSEIRMNENYDSYLFEVGSSQYFPLTYSYDEEVRGIKRILVLENTIKYLSPRLSQKIMENIAELSSPITGSLGGYAIYQEAMMMGFSNFTYFSFDRPLLEETLQSYSSAPTLSSQNLVLPDNIIVGHYSKSMQNGVIFKQIPTKIEETLDKLSLDEIVVSSKFMEKFSNDNKDNLTLAFTTNEQKLVNGKTLRDFKLVNLKVRAIINSDEIAIYHHEEWPILFFQCRIGVSAFHLGINTISFAVDEKSNADEVLLKAQKAFPDLNVVNPISYLNSGIDEVCFYLEIVMYIFSSISVFISIILLSICNYLHVLEIKSDIGLSRCIGVSKIESTKFIFSHSFLMSFVSFIISSIELIFVNYFIGKIIADNLEVSFAFVLNPWSFIWMFVLSFLISIFSSIIISFKVVKMSPLESLKVI